jgi:phosphatidylglycerophosphatase A
VHTRAVLHHLLKMNTKTDAAVPGGAAPAERPGSEKKPRFAIFVATVAGLGYFPKAPGTLGSLAGLVLAVFPFWFALVSDVHLNEAHWNNFGLIVFAQVFLTAVIAAVGVWSANRASEFWHIKDPQRVVIDEVSGQHLTLLLGCGIPLWWKAQAIPSRLNGLQNSLGSVLNWKYLLVGFILFRLFDIWKPFPARQAEALPGGWGIMADDWMAGIYAGIGLWLARAAGL